MCGKGIIIIDFDNLQGWFTHSLVNFRNRLDSDVSSMLISENPPIEIWAQMVVPGQAWWETEQKRNGVEILDRMKLYPGDADFCLIGSHFTN